MTGAPGFAGGWARPCAPPDAAQWDAFLARAPSGSLMQTRRFLDHHGERFQDLGLMGGRAGQDQPDWVMPLARDPGEPTRAVSHPGASFGGLVSRWREPAQNRAILRGVAGWLLGAGCDRLLYRAPPGAIPRLADEGLLPDLLALGRIVQHDLWSVIPLAPAPAPEHARAWAARLRKGQRRGLTLARPETPADWAVLHGLIAQRLARKYATRPVHSLAELQDLDHRLGPASWAFLVRGAQGEALGGFWFLDYGNGVLHNQYNAASEAGLAAGASGFAMAQALAQAQARGFRLVSLGRSTHADGFTENADLLRFKARLGAGLCSQFHIEIALDRLANLRS